MSLPTLWHLGCAGDFIMHKLTFSALAGLVAVALAAFGPHPWSDGVSLGQVVAVSPFNLTISVGPIPIAPTADTF
jgi:hypothetical protein